MLSLLFLLCAFDPEPSFQPGPDPDYELVFSTDEQNLNNGQYSGNSTIFDSVIVRAINSEFSNMRSTHFGGAIYMTNCQTMISDTIFVGCQSMAGSSLFMMDTPATIESTIFLDNTAYIQGGAIISFNCDFFTLQNTTFSNNAAGESSGCIAVDSVDDFYANSCIFTNNSAGTSGGAIGAFLSKSVIVHNCTFLDNYCGVPTEGELQSRQLRQSKASLLSSLFTGENNYRPSDILGGGAIATSGLDYIMVYESTFENNRIIQYNNNFPNRQGCDLYITNTTLFQCTENSFSPSEQTSIFIDSSVNKSDVFANQFKSSDPYPTWSPTETFVPQRIVVVHNQDDNEVINNAEPTIPPYYQEVQIPPEQTKLPQPTQPPDFVDSLNDNVRPTQINLPWPTPTQSVPPPTRSPTRSPSASRSPTPSATTRVGVSISISLSNSISLTLTVSISRSLQQSLFETVTVLYSQTVSVSKELIAVISYLPMGDDSASFYEPISVISYTEMLHSFEVSYSTVQNTIIETQREFFITIQVYSGSPIAIPLEIISEEQQESRVSNGLIIGVSCGGAAALFIIAGTVAFVVNKRKEDYESSFSDSDSLQETRIYPDDSSNELLTLSRTDTKDLIFDSDTDNFFI